MKQVRKFVCLVDSYIRPQLKHNTGGRYIVCAKTEKEAKQFLQDAIGFGSIKVYYEVEPNGKEYDWIQPTEGYIVQEWHDQFVEPHHANDSNETWWRPIEKPMQQAKNKYLQRRMRNCPDA